MVGPFPRRDLEGDDEPTEVVELRLEPKFLEAPRRLNGFESSAFGSDGGGTSGSLQVWREEQLMDILIDKIQNDKKVR